MTWSKGEGGREAGNKPKGDRMEVRGQSNGNLEIALPQLGLWVQFTPYN